MTPDALESAAAEEEVLMTGERFGRLHMELRSDFQFRLLELNLIMTGVLISVAFSNSKLWDALLVIPALSFMLFLFWVHHGFVIRLTNWERPAPWSFWQALRCGAFVLAMIGSFVGLPLASLLLHGRGPDRIPVALFSFAGRYVFPTLTLVLFALWFCLQYLMRTPPPGASSSKDD